MPPRRSFPRARPGKQEMQAARLDQPVHFIQQFREALDFVDDDDSVFRAKLLSHAPRILAESKIHGVIQ